VDIPERVEKESPDTEKIFQSESAGASLILAVVISTDLYVTASGLYQLYQRLGLKCVTVGLEIDRLQ